MPITFMDVVIFPINKIAYLQIPPSLLAAVPYHRYFHHPPGDWHGEPGQFLQRQSYIDEHLLIKIDRKLSSMMIQTTRNVNATVPNCVSILILKTQRKLQVGKPTHSLFVELTKNNPRELGSN
jgi:hypothetical protein